MKIKYNEIYNKFEICTKKGELYTKEEIKEQFKTGTFEIYNSASEKIHISNNIALLCTMLSVEFKNGYIIQIK